MEWRLERVLEGEGVWSAAWRERGREREGIFFLLIFRGGGVSLDIEEMGLEAETYYGLVGQMISLFIEFSDAQSTEFCVWQFSPLFYVRLTHYSPSLRLHDSISTVQI